MKVSKISWEPFSSLVPRLANRLLRPVSIEPVPTTSAGAVPTVSTEPVPTLVTVPVPVVAEDDFACLLNQIGMMSLVLNLQLQPHQQSHDQTIPASMNNPTPHQRSSRKVSTPEVGVTEDQSQPLSNIIASRMVDVIIAEALDKNLCYLIQCSIHLVSIASYRLGVPLIPILVYRPCHGPYLLLCFWRPDITLQALREYLCEKLHLLPSSLQCFWQDEVPGRGCTRDRVNGTEEPSSNITKDTRCLLVFGDQYVLPDATMFGRDNLDLVFGMGEYADMNHVIFLRKLQVLDRLVLCREDRSQEIATSFPYAQHIEDILEELEEERWFPDPDDEEPTASEQV